MENDSIVLGKFVHSVQYLLQCGSLGFEEDEPNIVAKRGTLDELAQTFPTDYLDIACFASKTLRKPLYVAKRDGNELLFVGDRFNQTKGVFERIAIKAVPIVKEGAIIIESIYFGGDSAVAERVKGWGLVNSLTHSLMERDFKGL